MTQEELGGANTHTVKSGVADNAYNNDIEAIKQTRRLIDFMPLNNKEKPPKRKVFDQHNREEKSLDNLIPINHNHPYDMHELIRKTVDEGDFFEIQPSFAKNIIIGFARIEGSAVGIVANQPMVLAGCLDNDASRKAALQF